jgi:uncharacterized protein
MEINLSAAKSYCIGVISDTHGRLSRAIRERLSPVDLIIHAGDIDTREVWETLNRIVPVVAAKGNMDWRPWAQYLNPTELIRVGTHWIYILHDLDQLDLEPSTVGIRTIISGHTHRSLIEKKNGITYLNPGSASFPRGSQKASMAVLNIHDSDIDVQLVSV